MGLALALPAYLISRRHGWRGERWGTGVEIRQAFREALWGLSLWLPHAFGLR